jgi:3-oxoacyl-[acyl-carrier protein] reductase
VVKGASRVMIKNGGSIVLISAACARIGMAYHDIVAATKAGIIGLTLSAAATYANRGIRVNCVAPGLINTGMTDSITLNAKQLSAAESNHPISRIGEPSDVVSAISWFLEPHNSWITGQIIGVDGGLGSLLARQSK